LNHMDIADQDVTSAFRRGMTNADASGMTLRDKIAAFAQILRTRVEEERVGLLDALSSIQTGAKRATANILDEGERSERASEIVLPNVRLVNGQIQRQTRERLMLAFNTPFFPEVLIASSVMAEGVDLHLNCRYVIHHDLDWNPSVLEQRAGRLDRLGSKSELTGKPVVVFEPFIEATQDEKQYRVVKDRERWFNILMGENLRLDEGGTQRIAERLELPDEVAKRLKMHLGLGDIG
jgi:superfamily II DNA/RNA helicase